MNFVPVQSFNNYVEAHIVMGNLQEQHINCWLKDEYTVTIDPILANAIGGIKLMVANVQAARALELLKQLDEEKKKQYTCPYCSSHDIRFITTPRKMINWFSSVATWLLGSYAIAVTQTWRCLTCGKEFQQPIEADKNLL